MNFLAPNIKKHLLNAQGKRLSRKYLVIESDDWGSERIPSKEKFNFLTGKGFDFRKNPFNYLDSLETENDLSALYEILNKYRDHKRNHPVITANFVTANPDFHRIKKSGFREYHYESIIDTYKNKETCKNSFSLIREGIHEGFLHPQFHGREHVNVKKWLSALKSGNEELLKAFDAGIYSIALKNGNEDPFIHLAAFDGPTEEDQKIHADIIEDGLTMFRKLFGYTPGSFIAPRYVWHPALERHLTAKGVKYLQGLPFQFVPHKDGNYKKIYHFQGERNKNKQVYTIRNCFFEPSVHKGIDWINDCLSRIKIIYLWGKPAVMGIHRINFMGGLDENNREKNLRDFSLLLQMILKKWPDVEFITSDQLGAIYDR